MFRHVEGLSTFLFKGDYKVSLAYSSRRGSEGLSALIEKVIARGGQAIDLDVINAPSFSDLSALWKLSEFIKEINPNIIHAHSSKAGALVRFLKNNNNKRPIFYTPNAYYGMARKNGLAEIYGAVERMLGKRAITINVSEDEAQFARNKLSIPRSLIRIIPNPVPTDQFFPATPEMQSMARQQLGFPKSAFIVGTTGRLSFQKDPMTAYQSIERLVGRYPSLYFAHLGHGELLPEINEFLHKTGIMSRVLRPQYMENPVAFYQALDGFLLTSRYEAGIPFVLLEALACGLPIVTTLPPGMSKITSMELSDCWTANVGDVHAVTTGIEAMIQRHASCMTTNHRQSIIQDYSPHICYGRVVQEYQKSLVPELQ